MDNFTDLQIKSLLEFDCSKLETDNEICVVEEIRPQAKEQIVVNSEIVINETINKKQSFKCNICDYTADYVPNYDLAYQNHMRTHGTMSIYDNLPVPCTECDFRCKTPTELSQHKKEHRSKLPYVCSDCGHKNLCGRQFNEHTKKFFHKIKCFKCDSKFVNVFAMQAHLANHITHHCQVCKRDLIFNSRDEVDHHVAEHQKKNTFNCKFCEKSFHHISHLKFHLLSHKGRGKNSKHRSWAAI